MFGILLTVAVTTKRCLCCIRQNFASPGFDVYRRVKREGLLVILPANILSVSAVLDASKGWRVMSLF